MKYFFSILAFMATSVCFGQITVVDTPHCLDHTLHAEVAGGIIPIASGITADDAWSAIIPIGFTFNFYGTSNTQCIIGSNGCLGFDLAYATLFNTWPIGNTLLGSTAAAPDIVNCICGPWCDVLISAGGTIDYSMQGTAPFRNFAVTWCGTHMYSCTAEWLTAQIVIYETTGIVEVHIGHRTICLTGWNGSHAIVGVKNLAGTVATVAPGRDFPTVWATTNEAWRFSPIAGPSYSVSSIPYAPIPYAASAIYWYDSSTGAYLGMGSDIHVSPGVPTTYIAAALGCSDTTKAYIHVLPSSAVFGGIPHINSVSPSDPTVCGKCDGSIILHGLSPFVADSIFYTYGGVPHPTIVDSAGVDSTYHFNSLCAGIYDNIYVKVGNCPSNIVGPIILNNPPVNVGVNYTTDFGCPPPQGIGDNVQFINLSSPTGAEFTSAWDFGDPTSGSNTSALTNPMHIYKTQGNYPVKLTYSTIYGCSADTTFTVPLIHPVYDSFQTQWNAICLGMSDGFTNYSTSSLNGASTSSLLRYFWEFGNGATDTMMNTEYTYPSYGKYTVKLTITDTIGCHATYTDTVKVISVDVKTGVHDTTVCLRDSMMLIAIPNVQTPTPFNYSWTPTNYIGEDSSSMTNFFAVGTYIYTVKVTTPAMPSNAFGCSEEDTEKITSYPPVTITNLTPNPQVIAYGSTIQLNANGAVYYTWKPDNGTLSNPNVSDPIATPTDTTTIYTVYGMNLYGCLDSGQVVVSVDYDMSEGLPTGFTPNGDGLNDVFKLTKLKFQKLVEFSVYNRWGQQVFRTTNPENGWDGTFNGSPQDIGAYNYIVIVARPDGTNKTYTGTITLIR